MVSKQETEPVRHGRRSLGFVQLLFIPACFVMHVAAPTTEITLFVQFFTTIHIAYNANCQKNKNLNLVTQKNTDLRGRNETLCRRHAFFHMLYLSKAGKKIRGAVFLPKTVCQILKRYKKKYGGNHCRYKPKKGREKEKKKVYSILSVTTESFE